MIRDTLRLRELFKKIGYTNEQYLRIINDYSINRLSEENVLTSVVRNYNYLLKYYKKNEIMKISLSLPAIYVYSTKYIEQKIMDYVSLGYTKEEVISMSKNNPHIYSLSMENINNKINNYLNLGYTKEEVIKMTKKIPSLYSYSVDNIKQKINDLILLGYSKEAIIKMTKKVPSIYGYSIDNIKKKLNDLKSFGYSEEKVIEITKEVPSIFTSSSYKKSIEMLMKYGYTKEEALKIFESFPGISSLSEENIKQKIDFYDSINMHELPVVDSKQLMQSVALTYARYMFYKDKGVDINMSFYKNLFMNNKKFENQYGVSKNELLEKYKYEESVKKEL